MKINVHLAKEWTGIEKVRKDTINDTETRDRFQRFLGDYEKIAKLGGWDKEEGLKMFSNDTYDEFMGRK